PGALLSLRSAHMGQAPGDAAAGAVSGFVKNSLPRNWCYSYVHHRSSLMAPGEAVGATMPRGACVARVVRGGLGKAIRNKRWTQSGMTINRSTASFAIG